MIDRQDDVDPAVEVVMDHLLVYHPVKNILELHDLTYRAKQSIPPTTDLSILLEKQSFRRTRGIWQYHTVILLLLVPCVQQLLLGAHAREADERSKFLYIHNPTALGIVWEYEPHMHAPHFAIEDRTELLADFAAHIAQTNVTEANVRPFFLRDEYPIQRIVEFYSPWCGACQSFVPRYISVAKEILNRLPPYHLEFYAVSCSEHHQLCQEENIQQYPTTRAFKPYSKDFLDFKRFTVESVDEMLGLDLQHKSIADADGHSLSMSHDREPSPSQESEEHHAHHKEDTAIDEALEEDEENMKTLDILGATNDVYRHTRTDVYRDAALSFTYALENHIFIDGQDELSQEQAAALGEWLDLLYWSLPPTWMVHALINDLRRNMEYIVKSKEMLLMIVRNHQGVVHDNKKHVWSQGCRSGEGVVASFSCGLWCLFHIVSVGVPERHAAVLGHRHRVSTLHAADTFMNYIRYFFSWCPQCREQALQLYNSCAFNSCRRFRQRNNKSQKLPPAQTWHEFPVWMWQFHNDINEKLMAKEAYKIYGRRPSKVELQLARWPPQDACFLCYRSRGIGNWNQHHVYNYLKEEYWPAGVQNFRFVVLDKKEAEQKSRTYSEYLEHLYDLLYFVTPRSQYEAFSAGAATIAILVSYIALSTTQKRLKMRKLRRTGRHKKYDVGPLFEVDA